MNISYIASIIFSFCVGLLLSPFNSGIIYLLFSIVIFGVIDYIFYDGRMEYKYMEYRASVISYGILGFIIGRTIHELPVIHNKGLHDIKDTNISIPCTLLPLYHDVNFISKINKNNKVNIISKRSLDFFKEPMYYCYSYLFFPTDEYKLYNYVNKTIESYNECLKIYKKEHEQLKNLVIIRNKLKQSLYNLPLQYEKIETLIKSIQ